MNTDNVFLLTALVSLQRHLGVVPNNGNDTTMELLRIVLQDQLNMFRDFRDEATPGAGDPAWIQAMIEALELILAYIGPGLKTSGASCEPQSLP
jgi:hypothetical protein